MPAEPAVLDAPEVHAEPATTNLGDVLEDAGAIFNREMAKSSDENKDAPQKPTAPAKVTPEAKPEDKPVEEAKPAPTSALEAALFETKPEDKPVDPLSELPETLPNDGRKDHWAKARGSIKSLSEKLGASEKTNAELQSKVSQVSENPEVKATLEKLQAENAELRDAITAANVELLPEFRQKYIEGAKTLIQTAQDKIKAYGGNPEALAEALGMPEGRRRDAAIAEAMGEEMSDTGKTKINLLVAEFDKLNDEAKSERANSQQSFERLTQKQQEQRAAQAKEIEARKAQTFEAVTKRLQAEVGTLRTVDPSIAGAEDWNSGVKAAFDRAQKLFGDGVTPEDTVATAIKGSDYDRVVGLLNESWKESAQLKKQLAELDSAQPDVKGGKEPVKTGLEATLEKTPGQLFTETMTKLTNQED